MALLPFPELSSALHSPSESLGRDLYQIRWDDGKTPKKNRDLGDSKKRLSGSLSNSIFFSALLLSIALIVVSIVEIIWNQNYSTEITVLACAGLIPLLSVASLAIGSHSHSARRDDRTDSRDADGFFGLLGEY